MAMCLMWRDVQSAGVAPAEVIVVSSRLNASRSEYVASASERLSPRAAANHGLIRVDFKGTRGDAMSKSGVTGGAARAQGRPPIQLWNVIEGQIVELCRDLAVQAKRMRQLQEQADELRIVFRGWSSTSRLSVNPVNRAGRR